jgi:hypothetical protein
MSLRALGEIVNRAREEEGYFFKVKKRDNTSALLLPFPEE